MRLRARSAEFAQNAPLTLRAIKLTLSSLTNGAAQLSEPGIEAAVQRCFESADYQEGIRAFLEKRKPAFRGV